MFDWIWRRVFTEKMVDSLLEKLLNRALDMMQTKEFQEQLCIITDSFYERYRAKLFTSIGGTMKGINAEANPSPLAGLVSKSGKVNWLQALGLILNQSGSGSQKQGHTLP